MLVTYTGPHPQETLAPVHGSIVMRQGEPVELPDEVAEALCRRPEFKVRKRRKPARTSSEEPNP